MKYLRFSLILVAVSYTIWADAHMTINLNGSNRDYQCSFRSTLLKGVSAPRLFYQNIHKLNLSIDCLAQKQRTFIEQTTKAVRGVTFGTHASVSKVVSIEGGVELVLTVVDHETLMIGLVKYSGAGASFGLPMGASITTGAIHGECKSISNYLGNFQNFSFFGMNESFGTANELTHPHRTHCDAASNTVGASMSLLGYSMTHYKALSKFYYLKGHRVEEIIEFITRYHPLPIGN